MSLKQQYEQDSIQTTQIGGSDRRFATYILDILASINFDKEEFLEEVVSRSGLTPEEFGVDHIIEEYPIEIDKTDILDTNNVEFTIKQTFRVRLKTDEERQFEIEADHEKEKNVEPDEF